VPVGFCGVGSAIAERLQAQAIAWQCGTAPQTEPRHFLRAAPPRRRPLPGWRHPAIWRRRDDLDRAIAEYNEAIRLNPEYAPAYWPAALHGRSSTVCKRHWLTSKCTLNLLHPTQGVPEALERVLEKW